MSLLKVSLSQTELTKPIVVIFFYWKIKKAFALQKLLTFYLAKNGCFYIHNGWKVNVLFTKDVVSFEQLDTDERGKYKDSTQKTDNNNNSNQPKKTALE